MANLTTIPAIDWFETTLSASWNGAVGSVSVNDVPSGTIESWETSYIVVNPWKSNMQVAQIDWWNSWTKTFNVTSITVEKGNGVNYSAQTHAANSVVRFSNNYAFWKDIRTAVNSKSSTDTSNTWSDTQTFDKVVATGYIKDAVYADATARDTAIPSPSNGMRIYNTAVWLFQKYQAWAWIDDTGGASTPNMSTSTTGKWRLADQTQVNDGTAMESWDPLVVWPAELKTVTDGINTAISWIILLWWFWDWVDGNVTINSWTTTLTSDMYYNNLTLTSPWVLNPNGFRVFVKGTFSGNGTIRRNGNAGTAASWSSVWVGGTVLNQGSMNAEIAWAWTNVAWVTANPSYHNVNGASAGTSWLGSSWAGTVPAVWVSTRWPRYNVGMTLSKLLELLPIAASWINSLNTLFVQYKGIAGWAWGWQWWPWDGFTAWSYGGGSWSNWGTIYIQASIWNFTWLIESIWWNGGNGSATNPSWGTNRWWWAGAAGGSGWVVIWIGKTFTSLYWTLTLTWGTGWTWGSKNWTWVAGTSWSTGTSWVFIQITTL